MVGEDCARTCVFRTSGEERRPVGPGGTRALLHGPLKGSQIKGVRLSQALFCSHCQLEQSPPCWPVMNGPFPLISPSVTADLNAGGGALGCSLSVPPEAGSP